MLTSSARTGVGSARNAPAPTKTRDRHVIVISVRDALMGKASPASLRRPGGEWADPWRWAHEDNHPSRMRTRSMPRLCRRSAATAFLLLLAAAAGQAQPRSREDCEAAHPAAVGRP